MYAHYLSGWSESAIEQKQSTTQTLYSQTEQTYPEHPYGGLAGTNAARD